MAPTQGSLVYIDLHSENLEKSSCLKPLDLGLPNLVYSFILWPSTKIVPIIALGSEMAPPRGSLVLHLYSESLGKSSCQELLGQMLPNLVCSFI